MRVKTILNQCYKFKSFVYDKVRFVREQGETFLEVVVLPRRNSQAICSHCAKPAALYDHLVWIVTQLLKPSRLGLLIVQLRL